MKNTVIKTFHTLMIFILIIQSISLLAKVLLHKISDFKNIHKVKYACTNFTFLDSFLG